MKKVNLREERESRGLSIRDVSHQARIPVHYLEALETGIVPQKLRGPILLSYKKKYLRFLHLPQEAKLRFRSTKKKLSSPASTAGRTRTLLTTTTNGIRQPSTLQSMGIGFALAVGCILCLKFLSTIFDRPAEAVETPASSIATSSVQDSTWLSDFFQKTAPISEAKADEPEQEESSTVSLYASDSTKVQFYCDDEVLFRGFLKPGKKHLQTCHFEKKVSVWIQDISRVRVFFNNRSLRPMGPQDTARTLTFER